MSEGASGAPDATVRLIMKRSSDSSHPVSGTQRHHTDHATCDVVMLLDDSDVSRTVEQCREVCRRTNCVPVAQMVRLCGTTRELMSNESCLVDILAAARNGNGNLQRKNIGKCVRQHKRGILGAVGHCEEFDPVLVHRAKMEEKDLTDKMGVYDVVPRSDAAEKGCRVIRTRWVTVIKGSGDAPPGGSPRSSVVVAVTNTSTSQRHLTLRYSKL